MRKKIKSKRFFAEHSAFTLAEVLITLSVIGVVAALTIPTLIQSYQKKVTATKLEKAYTDIYKAVIAAQAEHGMMSEWSGFKGNNTDNYKDFLENYIGSSLKFIKVCAPAKNECFKENITYMNGEIDSSIKQNYSTAVSAITQNGYSIYLWVNTEYIQNGVRTPHAQVKIDLDGPNKGENKYGKDVFGMVCYFQKVGDINAGCHLSGTIQKHSRDELLNDEAGCNKKGTGVYCGGLIQADCWQIKDDYPW